MEKQIKKRYEAVNCLRLQSMHPTGLFFCKIGFLLTFLMLVSSVFASPSNGDLLAGSTAQAVATLDGSGRNWMYLIDGGISLAAFAKTKNPFVFASVLVVAVAITVIINLVTGG